MPGFLSYSPVAQVRSIVIRIGACSTEIAIVVNRNAGTSENPNGRDLVSIVTQGFTLFAAAQAKESATEAWVLVEAGTATFPTAAAPIAARWPRGAGFGIPPATPISVIMIAIISSAGANDEGCATALLHPQTLPIDAPGTALNAGRTADLAIQADLVWIIAAAILAILIVGFASDALLSRGECGDYEKSKRRSEKAEKSIQLHELAPIEFEGHSAEPPGRASRKRRSMCEEPTTVHADFGLSITEGTTVPPASLGTGGASVDPYFHLGNSVLAA